MYHKLATFVIVINLLQIDNSFACRCLPVNLESQSKGTYNLTIYFHHYCKSNELISLKAALT